MAAISDLSDYLNLRTSVSPAAPQDISKFIDGRIGSTAAAAEVASRGKSFWQFNSTIGSGAIPGTGGVVPDNTTVGGMRQADPGGGRQLWISGASALTSNAGLYILYDRLLHNGGLNGTTLTAQTVGGTLTRNTTGAGNMIAVEIYAAIGSTATTAVINYTNQDGNPAVTPSFAIGGAGAQELGRMIFVPLAAGDTGVRGVTDIDLVASTLTAGSFGVVIMRPLLYLASSVAAMPASFDPASMRPGVKEAVTGACLAWAMIPMLTTNVVTGLLTVSLTEK
jgi:hypothetical protein